MLKSEWLFPLIKSLKLKVNSIYKWRIATHYKFTMKIASSSSHTELLACPCKWPLFSHLHVLLAVFCVQIVLFFPFRHIWIRAVLQGPFHALKSSRSFWTSSDQWCARPFVNCLASLFQFPRFYNRLMWVLT